MRWLMFTNSRTGSNVMLDMLQQTGVAGVQDVNDGHIFIGYDDSVPANYKKGWLEDYEQKNTTPNGVFGCKIGVQYFEVLIRGLPKFKAEEWVAGFDRYIILNRKDVVAQAVSRLIAKQTGEWQSNNKRKPVDPVYDFGKLTYFIANMNACQTFFETWVAAMNKPVLRMFYEDNAQDWNAAVRKFLAFIEVPCPRNLKLVERLKRQEDPLKPEWIARYNRELRQR